jgi:hypothetical protein
VLGVVFNEDLDEGTDGGVFATIKGGMALPLPSTQILQIGDSFGAGLLELSQQLGWLTGGIVFCFIRINGADNRPFLVHHPLNSGQRLNIYVTQMAQDIIDTPGMGRRPLLGSYRVNITQNACQIFASRGQGLQKHNAFTHKLPSLCGRL